MTTTAKTKTISQIGDTKFELVKNTHDAFRFTVEDRAAGATSPKTVMYISSEPADTVDIPDPLSTSGRITMSNVRTIGSTSTGSAVVDNDLSVGNKILIKESNTSGDATPETRAAIYAEGDTSGNNNHRLIIDPYTAESTTSGQANNGTVYIRGSLIVEGNKTILDTAEHITSENFLGINAVRDATSGVSGGTDTTAGIHVYSANEDTVEFYYDFSASKWLTGGKDLATGDITFTGGTVSGHLTTSGSGKFVGELDGNASTVTTISGHDIGSLNDVSVSSALQAGDILTYSSSGTWINSKSLTIKSTTVANYDPTTPTGAVVTDGGVLIKSNQALNLQSKNAALAVIGGAYIGGETYMNKLNTHEASIDSFTVDGTANSITFTENRNGVDSVTTHSIFDIASSTNAAGNATIYKRILGDDTIQVVSRGVSARTIGNIIPVELATGGGRTSTKSITQPHSAVPLHDDILSYYSDKTFASGKCVVALTDGTHASVAMFSFSVCGTLLTMVLDQEVHSMSSALSLDYDSGGTIDLNLGTAAEAVYCVKVLPIMTSDSITEQV